MDIRNNEKITATRKFRIILIVLYPIYFILSFIPRNKKTFVFGSSTGYKFSDNSKYLFIKYSFKYGKSRNIIWITRNKKIAEKITENKLKAYYIYSLKGIYFQLTAKYVFYSHKIYDISPILTAGAKIIALWHGIPIKLIGPEVDHKSGGDLKKTIRNIVNKFFPYSYYMHADYVISPMRKFNDRYNRGFICSKPVILNASQPRVQYLKKDSFYCYNDNLIFNSGDCHFFKKIKRYKTVIYWLPTFRVTGMKSFAKQCMCRIKYFNKINKVLVETQCLLIIKLHPIDGDIMQEFMSNSYSNILIYEGYDPYPLLRNVDILISDYSSIIYDFLSISGEVVLFCFDKKEYLKNVGLYCDLETEFNKLTIIYSWSGFINFFDKRLPVLIKN